MVWFDTSITHTRVGCIIFKQTDHFTWDLWYE